MNAPFDDIGSAFFTLSESDLAQIPVTAAPHNQLGFALQLCAIIPYLGFRRATPADLEVLIKWLMERALEHDKPTLLFQLAREKLLQERILRPGVTSLERLIVGVRQAAETETYRRLEPLLVESRRALLDTVSAVDETRGRSPLAWLQQGAVSNSPKAILGAIEKLEFLKDHGVQQWDITAVTPNRRKFLAQLARRSTNQALQRMPPGWRSHGFRPAEVAALRRR